MSDEKYVLGTRPDLIGAPMQRKDGVPKVTGAAAFISDIRLPGCLEGRVLRSNLPHARVLAVDTRRAEQLTGVFAVVTGQDTPRRRWGAFIQDQYPLAVDKVRYVGDEVAAVAAMDADTAEEALDLIDVEYEPLPATFDPHEAMLEGAPLIHDDHPNNLALEFKVVRGDPDAAFADADLVVADSFETHRQWHASIETIGCVAQGFPGGRLTMWLNTATVFQARRRIAWALDLAEEDLQVIQPYVGGAFGGKSVDDNIAMVCAMLAMKSSRAVRLINRREDEFLGTRPRVPMRIAVQMGFKNDGTIVAKEIRVLADKGAYAAKGTGVATVTALRHDLMYRCDNLRTELAVVYTNNIPTGAFRGFGNPAAAWAVEQVIDQAAAELGIEPPEMMLRNVISSDHVSPHGHVVKSCELAACIQRTTDLIDWSDKRRRGQTGRGIGFALSTHVSGQRRPAGDYDGATVILTITEAGRLRITCGEGETGSGAMTAWCQLAAAEIGVPFEAVSITSADTDVGPFALGSFASRSTFIVGNAVLDGARKIKRQIIAAAADQLHLSSDRLELKSGEVVLTPEGRVVGSVASVVSRELRKRDGRQLIAVGAWDSPSELQDEDRRFGNESAAYDFTCHAVEVEVDRETGSFRIIDYVAATDAGTIINPLGASGQIEGGLAQGLGYALTESLPYEEGRSAALNFSDYRLPSIADMPPLRHEFVESYEPNGPYGAKAVGEIAVDPVAPALANAIYDAVGVRIKSLPITPEKILAALSRGAD